MQPETGSQLSVVQMFPSLQLIVVPDWQLPPLQTSPLVQALPSSQGRVLFMVTQPVAGEQ